MERSGVLKLGRDVGFACSILGPQVGGAVRYSSTGAYSLG